MKTLIKDAIVVTVDRDATVLDPGAVVVEGRDIIDVGPSDAVSARHPQPDKVINASGKLLAPGFVSAHNHVGYAVFRGRA